MFYLEDKCLFELPLLLLIYLSAIPYIGDDIVKWVWGGFSVSNATLNRFFSLHYLLPFILIGLALIHLIALHEDGSNNPIGVRSDIDKVPFHHYYTVKDLFGVLILSIGLCVLAFLFPYLLGDAEILNKLILLLLRNI